MGPWVSKGSSRFRAGPPHITDEVMRSHAETGQSNGRNLGTAGSSAQGMLGRAVDHKARPTAVMQVCFASLCSTAAP